MNTMTPSTMTDGQIDKAVDLFRAGLRKHRSEFGSDAMQQTLGNKELVPELLGVFRKYVEMISDCVVRHFTCNRARTPNEVLNATGREQYIDREVVNSMPRGEGEEGDVAFFNLGRYVSDDNLEKEYELRGLKPADPYSLAAVNAADPAFADEHPNGTHWKDKNGNWCFAAFGRCADERRVGVRRRGGGWGGRWWFAGFRKN